MLMREKGGPGEPGGQAGGEGWRGWWGGRQQEGKGRLKPVAPSWRAARLQDCLWGEIGVLELGFSAGQQLLVRSLSV